MPKGKPTPFIFFALGGIFMAFLVYMNHRISSELDQFKTTPSSFPAAQKPIAQEKPAEDGVAKLPVIDPDNDPLAPMAKVAPKPKSADRAPVEKIYEVSGHTDVLTQ